MIFLLIINFLLAIAVSITNTVIPILATQYIGVSILTFATIEGFGELISCFIRVISGYTFDKSNNKRGVFIFAGFIALISKILLIVPTSTTIILTKFMERLSNGFFAAPRDAFAGVATTNKGSSLGLFSTFKTAGLIIGSWATGVYLSYSDYLYELDSIKKLILIAAILCINCTILAFFINIELPVINKTKSFDNSILKDSFNECINFIKNCKWLLVLFGIFFISRFTDGLILLFLKDNGFPKLFYTSYIGVFNTIMCIASPIFGLMLDRGKKVACVYITIISMILFNICALLIDGSNLYLGSKLLVFWGIQRVGAQIVFTSLIFDKVPKDNYGVAIGVYSVLIGLCGFLGSLIAGYLQSYSYTYLFSFTLMISILSMVIFRVKVQHEITS